MKKVRKGETLLSSSSSRPRKKQKTREEEVLWNSEEEEEQEEQEQETKKPTRAKSQGTWVFYLLRYWFPPKVAGNDWIPSDKTYCGITIDFPSRLRQHNRDVGVKRTDQEHKRSTNILPRKGDHELCWFPPTKGKARGASRTSKVLRAFPGGIWMPELLVHGFGSGEKEETTIRYFEHLNQKLKPIVTKMFSAAHYGREGARAPHSPDSFTAANLGVDRESFHVLKILTLPKWSAKGASPPVRQSLRVQFMSPRFLPKRMDLFRKMLSCQSYVDVDASCLACSASSTSTWLAPSLLLPRSFFPSTSD